MASRLVWTGLGPFVAIVVVAVVLTAWQVQVDDSVFEPYFGTLSPTGVMVATALVGVLAMAYLQATYRSRGDRAGRGARCRQGPRVVGPATRRVGHRRRPAPALPGGHQRGPAGRAPLLSGDRGVRRDRAAHGADRRARAAPGAPTGLDLTSWRIAVPVAVIEAALQAVFATSVGTSVFSAVQLVVFGLVQVWVFWRFGFVWMRTFRLAYYVLWHLAWGAARLQLLF